MKVRYNNDERQALAMIRKELENGNDKIELDKIITKLKMTEYSERRKLAALVMRRLMAKQSDHGIIIERISEMGRGKRAVYNIQYEGS